MSDHAISRRQCLALAAAGLSSGAFVPRSLAEDRNSRDLQIKEMRITPIALPDPPILAASGCHGPYFLRTIVEIETTDGITGIGESYGNPEIIGAFERARNVIRGSSAFAYRQWKVDLKNEHPAVYAGIEMACLDALGKATGRQVCELLGGPHREHVEFAAYLFYRYAADHPRVLDDERLVDARGRGDNALDQWGEVRTAEAMVELVAKFRERWGFRVLKLKAGVLPVHEEIRTMEMMAERFGPDVPLRIDPNGRWTVPTAISAGRDLKKLPLEYYEDPVAGQNAMADVRIQTGLRMATNSCVSRWSHVRHAVRTEPIDVVLGDIYWYGGITGLQALGTAASHLGWGLGYHSNNHAGVTMAVMIHAAAAVPELTYAADTHYVWLADGADVIEGPNLPIVDGKMGIPEGSGLGVKLDRDKLARAHERYEKSGMRQRSDADTMRRLEPGWERTLF